MRSRLQTLGGRTVLASAVVVAVLAATLTVLVLAIDRGRDEQAEARRSQDVVLAAQRLQVDVLDAETGLRGFLITGDRSFLAPLERARTAYEQDAANLEALLQDRPDQAAAAARFSAGFARYLELYVEPQIERRERSGEEARQIALSAQGKGATDALRRQINPLLRRERALSAQRADAAGATADRARAVAAGGLMLSLLIVIGFAVYVRRSVVSPLRRVSEAARALAAGDLDMRVPRRTGDDEVADLGQAFNMMAASLAEQRVQLERQNRSLGRHGTQLAGAVDRLGSEKARVERLLRFGRRVSLETEPERLAEVMLAELADLSTATHSALYAVAADSEDGTPELLACRGFDPPPPAPSELLEEPTIVDGSRLAVPLRFGDRAFGVLLLATAEDNAPNLADGEVVADLARQAAASLASALSLRAARERASVIRTVLDSTPDAIALLDRTGRTLLENPPMRQVRAALIDSVREPGGGYRASVLSYTGQELGEVRDELVLLGTGRTYARYIAPVQSLEGESLGRLVVMREVTAERESERLKDEFFALVSHELRTPLTSIIGYLELVLDPAESLDSEHRSYLEVVERNARRLLRLVGDLLFVAQVEAGTLALEPGTVDLDQLTQEAVEAARPRAESAGIELETDLRPVAPTAGDRDRLGQVLDNLVANAIKFTPAGGRVTVRLSERASRVVLDVHDTGPGIPEDEQARLFDRFFRAAAATDAAVPGLGLGLTIVKAIVEAHGGRVSLHSEVGTGTTFTVELPPGTPQEARTESVYDEAGAASSDAPGGRYR